MVQESGAVATAAAIDHTSVGQTGDGNVRQVRGMSAAGLSPDVQHVRDDRDDYATDGPYSVQFAGRRGCPVGAAHCSCGLCVPRRLSVHLLPNCKWLV